MDYNTKFPIEYFDEIWADADISAAVSELAKRAGINPLQPALFSDYEWGVALTERIDPASADVYKTISTLTAWGFNKTIFITSRAFIHALAVSDYDEIDDEIERLFGFTGCAYFEGDWHWHPDLLVQGHWMTVVNHGDGTGCIRVVINSLYGLSAYDVSIDKRGLYDCLVDSVPGVAAYMEMDKPSSATEETLKAVALYAGLVNAVRVAHYLLSDNVEVDPQHKLRTYRFKKDGEIFVPEQMAVFEVGKEAGLIVEQAEAEGVVKPAHWNIETDGSIKWLCAHESQSENILECEVMELRDGDLAIINEGRHEIDFVVTLAEELPKDIEPGIATWDILSAGGTEIVHQARARVAAANGDTYDR